MYDLTFCIIFPSPISPPPGASGARVNPPGMVVAPLKLALVGKIISRCLKMPFKGQLDPNMTPTWPSLGPPEGQSDLYFTILF